MKVSKEHIAGMTTTIKKSLGDKSSVAYVDNLYKSFTLDSKLMAIYHATKCSEYLGDQEVGGYCTIYNDENILTAMKYIWRHLDENK